MSKTQELTITEEKRERVDRLRLLMGNDDDEIAIWSAVRIITNLLDDFHAGADIVVQNRNGSTQKIRFTDGNGGWLKKNQHLVAP